MFARPKNMQSKNNKPSKPERKYDQFVLDEYKKLDDLIPKQKNLEKVFGDLK